MIVTVGFWRYFGVCPALELIGVRPGGSAARAGSSYAALFKIAPSPCPAPASGVWNLAAGPTRRTAAVVQAGQNGHCLAVQQFKMQCIGKAPQEDAPKTRLGRRKCFRGAGKLLCSGGNDAQEIAAKAIRLLFVPLECLGNFSLCRGFEFDDPTHKFTPSDWAICRRLFPCFG